ncbi:MAG: hypothetical protein ACREMN_10715, partial [Gemmatimonadales bacterium]
MNLGPVLICALLAAPAARLGAQTQASLGVGVGTVRYTRGASFSAASVMPAVERLTPSLYLGGSAMLSVLGDGAWAGQARADLWAASPPLAASTRFALSAGGAAATRSDGLASAAGSLLGEIVYTAARGGGAVGIGSVGGVLEGEPAVGGLRVRARVWWQRQGDHATLSVESTRFFGAWYSDLLVGYMIERPRVSASVWLNGRVSGTYTSSAAASASLRYFVTPTVALEA